jgi:hypothetical protein
MKKLVQAAFFGICLMFGFSSFSQTVNGVALTDLDVEYITIEIKLIHVKGKGYLNRVHINFGKNRVSISYNADNILRDRYGDPIHFDTMLDALNFFAKNGFELAQAYVASYDSFPDFHCYILRRKQTH